MPDGTGNFVTASPNRRVAYEFPAANAERESDMVGTDAQEHDEGVLRALRPGEAAALVETFQQAQAAEAAVRGFVRAVRHPRLGRATCGVAG